MSRFKRWLQIPVPVWLVGLLISPVIASYNLLFPEQPVPAISLLDSTPRLAVMSASAPELRRLLEAAEITNSYVLNGRTYSTGKLIGNEVVIVYSGVSMVNAAMATQSILDHFKITGIVFSGIAGGVNPQLNVSDVVVPAQWGQYQEQVFARGTAHGWDVGWHNRQYGNFGMMFPQAAFVPGRNNLIGGEETKFWFEADPAMLEVARQVANSVSLDSCTFYYLCLEHQPVVRVGGNGVSGPTFVDNATYRTWVRDTFEAQALDMETAAVAHVAYVNNAPYIAFRSLSDLAGGDTGPNETTIFFQLAADNAAKVVTGFLEVWARQKSPP